MLKKILLLGSIVSCCIITTVFAESFRTDHVVNSYFPNKIPQPLAETRAVTYVTPEGDRSVGVLIDLRSPRSGDIRKLSSPSGYSWSVNFDADGDYVYLRNAFPGETLVATGRDNRVLGTVNANASNSNLLKASNESLSSTASPRIMIHSTPIRDGQGRPDQAGVVLVVDNVAVLGSRRIEVVDVGGTRYSFRAADLNSPVVLSLNQESSSVEIKVRDSADNVLQVSQISEFNRSESYVVYIK